MNRAIRLACLTVFLASIGGGCTLRRGDVHATLLDAADSDDCLVIHDTLESLIANGQATRADREFAYDQLRSREDDSAGCAFAHAAIAGRIVQEKGLLAAPLLHEAEKYARRSRELDPNFRDGAATRMLGTLYVVAPGKLLEHGDSEIGLDLLEQLAKQRPDVPENHLRLAEAYIMLHDTDPARPHLCQVQTRRALLRQDDQALLDRLVKEVGKLNCQD